MKHINLNTGYININWPYSISVSVYLHQPLPAQSPHLTSILSSCAPRCCRGECSVTLMRWKTKYQRCTEKYERQEMCLGIYHFDRLCSFSEPAHSLWARGKQVMMLAHCGKPCWIALTRVVLHQFCCLNAATHWSWAHLISRAKYSPLSAPWTPEGWAHRDMHPFPKVLQLLKQAWAHLVLIDWTIPPPLLQVGALSVFLFLIHSTTSNFERLYFTFYFLSFPLFCNAWCWHCYLCHISRTILIFYVIWFFA